MNYIKHILLTLAVISCICLSCNTFRPRISVSYELEKLGKNLIKVEYSLRNNDSIDYFVPLIKPAYKYSTIAYNDSTRWVQSGVDVAFLLGENLLSRSELMETAELDSMTYFPDNDTVLFYFEHPSIKSIYDDILSKFDDPKNIKFIYPFIYHAIGNGCIYIHKGEIKKILMYIYHAYPIDISKLHISFDFNTDSIPDFREEYFKKIPKAIEGYHLFYGRINN